MNIRLNMRNLDVKLAIIGVLLFSVFAVTLRSNLQILLICLTLTISCILYLFRLRYEEKTTIENLQNNRVSIIIYSLVFLLISLSFIIFSSRSSLYIRPTTYFLCIAFSISLITMHVLFVPCSLKYDVLTLLSIVLISFSLRLTPQLMYPDLVGIDPWVHREFTNYFVNFGHILDGIGYSRMPAFHLIIGITSILTTLEYKFSSILSITLLQAISFIFIYLAGRSVFKSQNWFTWNYFVIYITNFNFAGVLDSSNGVWFDYFYNFNFLIG